jgi:hypothetical protein
MIQNSDAKWTYQAPNGEVASRLLAQLIRLKRIYNF